MPRRNLDASSAMGAEIGVKSREIKTATPPSTAAEVERLKAQRPRTGQEIRPTESRLLVKKKLEHALEHAKEVYAQLVDANVEPFSLQGQQDEINRLQKKYDDMTQETDAAKAKVQVQEKELDKFKENLRISKAKEVLAKNPDVAYVEDLKKRTAAATRAKQATVPENVVDMKALKYKLNAIKETKFQEKEVDEWMARGEQETEKVKRAESPEDFSDLEKMPSPAERVVEAKRPLAEIEIENNTEVIKDRLLERYGLTDNQKYDAKLYLQQEINKGFEAKAEYKAAKASLIQAYRQLKQFDNIPDEELLVRKIGMFEFRFGDGRKVRKNFEALQTLENDQKKTELRNFFDEEARSLLNAGYDIRRGNDALGAKIGRVVRATSTGMKRGTVFPGKA